jgi:hypothetical protein
VSRLSSEDLLAGPSGPARARILTELAAIAAGQQTGDLVIRQGDVVGWIHCVEGQIGWVHTDGYAGHFSDLVVEHVAIDREVLMQLIASCRRSGKPLGGTLVAEGYLTAAALEGLLREQIRRQLQFLLEHPACDAVLFLPARRRVVASQAFALDEVITDVPAAGLPEAAAADFASLVDHLDRVPGAIGAALIALTGERAVAAFEVGMVEGATELDEAALRRWARHVAANAAATDARSHFGPLETFHISEEYWLYERRDPDTIVLVSAAQVGDQARFMKSVRAATRR